MHTAHCKTSDAKIAKRFSKPFPPEELAPAACSESDCCEDWNPQTIIIDSYIVLHAIRAGEPNQFKERGGKPFKFCPWCGKKRP